MKKNSNSEIKQKSKNNRKAMTRAGRNARWLWGITLSLFIVFFIGFGSFLLYKNITTDPVSDLSQITKKFEEHQNGEKSSNNSNSTQ